MSWYILIMTYVYASEGHVLWVFIIGFKLMIVDWMIDSEDYKPHKGRSGIWELNIHMIFKWLKMVVSWWFIQTWY